MPNAFDVLAKDHQEVKQILAELERGPVAATGADPDQLALRKKMVQQLVIEESRHEAVEEMYFWPAVRKHLTDGDDLANQAQDQEQEGKVVLDRLDKLAPADEEFEDQLARFTSAGREHIRFEETVVWPGLRAALSAAEADDLGRELEEGKTTAPTRPHPHTPASPGLLKTAGPAVAAADRLRDAATGRDQ
jgi:hemerythrin-like domain-containing protein